MYMKSTLFVKSIHMGRKGFLHCYNDAVFDSLQFGLTPENVRCEYILQWSALDMSVIQIRTCLQTGRCKHCPPPSSSTVEVDG